MLDASMRIIRTQTGAAMLRNGGPLPLLTRLQPCMVPAISTVELLLLALIWLCGRKQRCSATGPHLLRGPGCRF